MFEELDISKTNNYIKQFWNSSTLIRNFEQEDQMNPNSQYNFFLLYFFKSKKITKIGMFHRSKNYHFHKFILHNYSCKKTQI
ncbi:hypothetical protein pb186bvf_019007 [Paramecium bursaria]